MARDSNVRPPRFSSSLPPNGNTRPPSQPNILPPSPQSFPELARLKHENA